MEQPILRNPYDATGLIEKPEQFFNRKKLIEQSYDLLFADSAQCISFVGTRKAGKSSLVKHLMRSETMKQFGYSSGQYLFVFIDCAQLPNTVSSEDVYSLLVKSICLQLAKSFPRKKVDINQANPASWQREWESLLTQLAKQRITTVIALDEFDTAVMNQQLIEERIFGSLRGYYSAYKVVWITCTDQPLLPLFEQAFETYKISDAQKNSASDFYSMFTGYLAVGLFDQQDIENLVSIPAAREGISFSAGVATDAIKDVADIPAAREGISFSAVEQRMIRDFGGHFPYFVQRACYHLVEAHRKHEEVRINKVLTTCRQEAEPFWKRYWEKLSAHQQRVLYSVASGHPVDAPGELASLRDASMIYEEFDQPFAFSEEFARFIRRREHSHMGLPVNPGDILWKYYQVEEIIGRTLHSQVVKALHLKLKRHWAIKLLYINEDDDFYSELMNRETDILSDLNHKHINWIHDIREEPLAIIMPWIEGRSLQTIIEEDPPWKPEQVIKLGRQLADALAYVHSMDITHRDIKPNNIILNTDGDAILIDFDVARAKNLHTITRRENQPPRYVGNKEYGAPEQLEKPVENADQVGPHSDVFALGIILYQLLTHERPYRYGNDPRRYDGILPVPERQDIPEALYQILQGMLQQDPDDRPDAKDVFEKLQLLSELEGKPNHAQ